MDKEVKIVPPEGYEIDKDNSTFECIKFKLITKRWRDDREKKVDGYFICSSDSMIQYVHNLPNSFYSHNVFATEKQAKSALAMARISQIMANDERFGGVITDEEWKDENKIKYVISRCDNKVHKDTLVCIFRFLAFHTAEQRDLFLKENEDLVKNYLML